MNPQINKKLEYSIGFKPWLQKFYCPPVSVLTYTNDGQVPDLDLGMSEFK